MNRYQVEVAQMDRRHRLAVRALSFVGAAGLMVAILWSAGSPPTQWLARAEAWFSGSRHSQSAEAMSPPPSPQQPAESPQIVSTPSTAVLPGTDSSISPTPQALFLIAATPGRNEREGTASIGTNPDNPQTYAAGAILANGARLTQIHLDHVVLTRGDASARLSLYRRNAVTKLPANELLTVGGEQRSAVVVAPTREMLTDYLRPSPLYDGETLRGYEVYPGPKVAVFSRLGLESGDVITSLNDTPFADPSHAMELFNQLTSGVAIVATIQRKGRSQRITLDGAIIAADQEAAANAAAQVAHPVGPAT